MANDKIMECRSPLVLVCIRNKFVKKEASIVFIQTALKWKKGIANSIKCNFRLYKKIVPKDFYLRFSAGKYRAAEKWCGMGMRLMKQLADLKHFYETKVGSFSIST